MISLALACGTATARAEEERVDNRLTSLLRLIDNARGREYLAYRSVLLASPEWLPELEKVKEHDPVRYALYLRMKFPESCAIVDREHAVERRKWIKAWDNYAKPQPEERSWPLGSGRHAAYKVLEDIIYRNDLGNEWYALFLEHGLKIEDDPWWRREPGVIAERCCRFESPVQALFRTWTFDYLLRTDDEAIKCGVVYGCSGQFFMDNMDQIIRLFGDRSKYVRFAVAHRITFEHDNELIGNREIALLRQWLLNDEFEWGKTQLVRLHSWRLMPLEILIQLRRRSSYPLLIREIDSVLESIFRGQRVFEDQRMGDLFSSLLGTKDDAEEPPPTRKTQEEAAKILKSLGVWSVYWALRGLEDSRTGDVWEHLPAVLRDAASREVRERLLEVVLSAGAVALPEIEHFLDNDDAPPERRISVMRAAARIGSLSAATLARSLTKGPDEVRRSAAEILGTMGKEAMDAVPVLERALQDPDASVRAAADLALKKIRGR